MNMEKDNLGSESELAVKEFTIAHKWMMIPIGVVFAGFCAVLVCKRIEPVWVGALCAIFLSGAFVLSTVFMLTWRFVVRPDRFIESSVFGTRELRFDEILGYRDATVKSKGGERTILIVPKDTRKRKLRMSTFVKGADEFEYWLSERFADLDAKEP